MINFEQVVAIDLIFLLILRAWFYRQTIVIFQEKLVILDIRGSSAEFCKW